MVTFSCQSVDSLALAMFNHIVVIQNLPTLFCFPFGNHITSFLLIQSGARHYLLKGCNRLRFFMLLIWYFSLFLCHLKLIVQIFHESSEHLGLLDRPYQVLRQMSSVQVWTIKNRCNKLWFTAPSFVQISHHHCQCHCVDRESGKQVY